MNYGAYLAILAGNADNPYHVQHVYEFHDLVKLMIQELTPQIVQEELEKQSEAMNEKIRTQIQEELRQQKDRQEVNVQTYFNGKPATDANIVKGVRDMVVKALKHVGMGR